MKVNIKRSNLKPYIHWFYIFKKMYIHQRSYIDKNLSCYIPISSSFPFGTLSAGLKEFVPAYSYKIWNCNAEFFFSGWIFFYLRSKYTWYLLTVFKDTAFINLTKTCTGSALQNFELLIQFPQHQLVALSASSLRSAKNRLTKTKQTITSANQEASLGSCDATCQILLIQKLFLVARVSIFSQWASVYHWFITCSSHIILSYVNLYFCPCKIRTNYC